MSQLFEVQYYIYRYCCASAKRKETNEDEEEHKEETGSLVEQLASGEYDLMSLASNLSWFKDDTP